MIPSKQKPRKINIHGNDGKSYSFLLKGKEDLRLDERVMQLFGLVNLCLRNDNECFNRNLGIRRYFATPLSYETGLVEWVENTDTLNTLIKKYRESCHIPYHLEQRYLLKNGPYDSLCYLQKVELFENMLNHTNGSISL